MKIVMIGGSGLIGSKLVNTLRKGGRDVVAASLSTGVNTTPCSPSRRMMWSRRWLM